MYLSPSDCFLIESFVIYLLIFISKVFKKFLPLDPVFGTFQPLKSIPPTQLPTYSNIGKVRSRAKSFRYGDHRRSTLAVIFEPPSKFSNLVLPMTYNSGNTEMRTSKMAQLNNRISRVTWRTGSEGDQPDVRTGSLRSESV